MKNNLYTTKRSSGFGCLLIVLLLCLTGWSSSTTAATITSTNMGGLWSSPATWVGGVVPSAFSDVVIADGATVTIDATIAIGAVKDVTIGQGASGILQFSFPGAVNLTVNFGGNVLINPGAKLFTHLSAGGTALLILTVAGDFTNNGFANMSLCVLEFRGAQNTPGFVASSSIIGGSGYWVCDSTAGPAYGKAMIRNLRAASSTNFSQTPANVNFGDVTISSSISQPIVVPATISATTGNTFNTNNKLTLYNGAMLHGLALNREVSYVAVTNMGSGYTSAPVVGPSGSLNWTAGSIAVGAVRVNGSNVYVCTVGGTSSIAPTHGTGTSTGVDLVTWLWVGNTGTIGIPFGSTATLAPVLGTQYFYGNNLYTCTATGAISAIQAQSPPTHSTGAQFVPGTSAEFLYVGSPAKVSVNWDGSTVRSLNLIDKGFGYIASGTNQAMVILNTGSGSGAAATAAVIQSTIGAVTEQVTRAQGVVINGTIDITSEQRVSRIVITNGGVYNTAPVVGIQLPHSYRNLVNLGGSGYLDATVSVSGGVRLSSGTDPAFNVVLAQGKVVSIIGTGAGVGWLVAPNIVITSSTGTGATASYPIGSLATATANLTDRTITSFTVTNPGNDYSAAPGVLLDGPFVVSPGTTALARIGLYNLLTGFFGGDPVTGYEGPEIPTNRRINSMTQQSLPYHFAGNLEVYGAAFAFASGLIYMNSYNLNFTNPFYSGNLGSPGSHVKDGSVTLSSPGGNVSLSFPFNGISVTTGGNTVANSSTITRLKASSGGIPSGIVDAGLIAGMKSFRIETLIPGETYGVAAGANPVVTLRYSSQDGLETDSANLYIAHSTSLSGPWAVRSLSVGLPGGELGATGSRSTSQTSPGPLVLTGNDYFTWAETAPPYPGVEYLVTRSVAQPYSSIMPSALGGNGTGVTFGWTGTLDSDDGITNIVSIPSSTFTYHGETVTGFRAITNGFMVLATSKNPSISAANYYYDWDSGLPQSVNKNMVAPFMDDLTTNPDNNSIPTLDSSMRYFISPGAPGFRTITVEWYRMTLFGLAGPELYFQVVLNENGNTIKFNYGNMQCYNGTHDIRWTYVTGLGGRFLQPDPKAGQMLIQQFENTTAFSHNNGAVVNSGANGLSIAPEPRSSILFTPGTPAAVIAPVPTQPSNDNYGAAIPLEALTVFPTNIAWNNTLNVSNLFSSRYATNSPEAICGGSPSAKDVWFTFIANETNMQVRIYASGGYIPRLEVLDGTNLPPTPLSPVKCILGQQGLTASASMTGLSTGSTYYVRVYHDATGTTATAQAVINNGVVTSVNVINGGSNYFQANDGQVPTPRITFSGGGGEGAVADIILTGNSVSNVIVLNGGRNYSAAPTVTIESPDYGLTGEFGVIVFAQAPNDDCDNAIALTNLTNLGCVNNQNSRSSVVTSAANPSLLEATCTGTPDDDVWYKFLAANDSALITVTGFSGFDPVVQVFDGGLSGGNCATKTPLTPAVCRNLTSTNGTEAPIIGTTAGRTYFIRVYHAGVGSGGIGAKFDICISSAPPLCLVSPVNPVHGGNSCNATLLKWNTSLGATRYDVILDGNTVSSNQSDTTYNAGVLSTGGHTWTIVPKNASGTASGCPVWTFNAVVRPTISISPNAANSSYCGTGGSLNLMASGAGNYTWSPATDINVTTGASVVVSPPYVAGSYQSDYVYTVIGYTALGCPDTSSRTVTVNRIPPAPTATGYNICLNGSIPPGQGLVANCKQEVLTTTIEFTRVPIDLITNEGVNCPGNHIVGQFTLPALPSGASYISAKVIITGIRQYCSGAFASEIGLHFSGTGVSGTSGCYTGNQFSSQFPFIDYVTGNGLNAGDTAIVAGLLNPAGGQVTLRYRESFDDCPTVPDYIFTGVGTITLQYLAPANTVKWYDGSNALVSSGSPFAPTTNSPSGSVPFSARCVTSGNCESVGAPANLVIGNPISVTASHTATSTICGNTPDTLTSTVTGGGQPYSYSWSNGISVVSTSASFIAFPAVTTTYTLTVTHGCTPVGSNTSSVTTTVIAAPPVNATQLGQICSGVGTVALNATGANTYAWSPATGLSATNSASVNASPGLTTTYTVIGTNTSSGCSSPFTITVTNNPNISMTVSATPNIVCKDSTSQLASTARFDTIPTGYCVPFQSTTGTGACIDTISFNTMLHKSTACSGTYYADVPSSVATTTLIPGNTYAFHASFNGPAASVVWIDYNQSGIFATFEGQQISTYESSVTIMITIPTDAVPGYTKMRVRSRQLGSFNTTGTPCGTFPESGSTNDFIVRIGTASSNSGTFGYLWTANPELNNVAIPNPIATPATVGLNTYTLKVTEVSGCNKMQSVDVTSILCLSTATVNIKAFIQGYYISGGQMTPTLYNQLIPGATDAMVDTVIIEARDANTFALVDSYTAILDTGGNVTGTMSLASINTPYYFAVRHRNTLYTCSANPLLLTSVTNYNFTLSPLSSYGFNEIVLSDGRYGFFSGDVNQDEYIDTGDVTPVDNDNLSGLYSPGGYWLSDINGDGYVDTGDVTPTDNNNLAGVFSQHP